MVDSVAEARKRQIARLDGVKPPTARKAMALAKSKAYQDGADAEATLRAYATDVANFHAWCSKYGFTAMPATPEVVGAYLAAAGEGNAMPTLRPQRIGTEGLADMVHSYVDRQRVRAPSRDPRRSVQAMHRKHGRWRRDNSVRHYVCFRICRQVDWHHHRRIFCPDRQGESPGNRQRIWSSSKYCSCEKPPASTRRMAGAVIVAACVMLET